MIVQPCLPSLGHSLITLLIHLATENSHYAIPFILMEASSTLVAECPDSGSEYSAESEIDGDCDSDDGVPHDEAVSKQSTTRANSYMSPASSSGHSQLSNFVTSSIDPTSTTAHMMLPLDRALLTPAQEIVNHNTCFISDQVCLTLGVVERPADYMF